MYFCYFFWKGSIYVYAILKRLYTIYYFINSFILFINKYSKTFYVEFWLILCDFDLFGCGQPTKFLNWIYFHTGPRPVALLPFLHLTTCGYNDWESGMLWYKIVKFLVATSKGFGTHSTHQAFVRSRSFQPLHCSPKTVLP